MDIHISGIVEIYPKWCGGCSWWIAIVRANHCIGLSPVCLVSSCVKSCFIYFRISSGEVKRWCIQGVPLKKGSLSTVNPWKSNHNWLFGQCEHEVSSSLSQPCRELQIQPDREVRWSGNLYFFMILNWGWMILRKYLEMSFDSKKRKMIILLQAPL